MAEATGRARHHAAAGAARRAARLLLDAAPAARSPAERERLVIAAAGHLVGSGQGMSDLAAEIEGFGDSVERGALLGRLALLTALAGRGPGLARPDVGAAPGR